MSQEEKNIPVEQQRLEKEQIEDMGSVYRTRGAHAIHCLTVIGQVEGHVEAPQGQKTTKYEHVIPQLVAVQEDPAIEGLLVLLNTVGGDVRRGLRWRSSSPASPSPVRRWCWAGATPSASRWPSAPSGASSCLLPP